MKAHASDCALHNGPATLPRSCSCGADPYMTPIEYGSEFPSDRDMRVYDAGLKDGADYVRRATGTL